MAVTSALVDNATRTSSSSTSATITGAGFGSAFSGRVLIDAVITDGDAMTSATIGGTSAVKTMDSGSANGLLSAVVASGTSGNIVGSFGVASTFNSVGVIALTGAASATPTDTIVNESGGSGTIDVPAGGCVVAMTIASSSGSWTGATQVRVDTTVLGIPISIATFDNSGGALTNRSISYSTGLALFAAAFDASGGGGGGGIVAKSCILSQAIQRASNW